MLKVTDHNIEMQQAKAQEIALQNFAFSIFSIQTALRPCIGRVTLSGNIAQAVRLPYLMTKRSLFSDPLAISARVTLLIGSLYLHVNRL